MMTRSLIKRISRAHRGGANAGSAFRSREGDNRVRVALDNISQPGQGSRRD
jgi:hypothetical protein